MKVDIVELAYKISMIKPHLFVLFGSCCVVESVKTLTNSIILNANNLLNPLKAENYKLQNDYVYFQTNLQCFQFCVISDD